MNCNVSTALSGFIRAHNGLRLIQDRNCVLRADTSELDAESSRRVRLISGGGSGHEPAFAGYVGQGMLDGAVCGDVFAAPSATAILDCLRTVAGDPGGSVLFVVNNYTGDRLNFGLALERARSLYGYSRVRLLLNDEDCSIEDLTVARSVGRRGLAGIVLLIKVLGAMAELGFGLDEIYAFGDAILRQGHIVTFGFTFEMAAQGDKLRSVELGKGLHGEPGVYRMDECEGFEPIVRFMMEKMIRKVPEFAEVVVLVNNLGSTPEIAVGVFLDVLTKLLETRYRIRRIYCGTYFSSLSQMGLSVTLLNLGYSDQLFTYLDHAVQVASPFFGSKPCFNLQRSETVKFDTINEAEALPNPFLFKLTLPESSKSLVHDTLQHIAQVLQTSRELLNTFDRECGDGDTGNTIANGATALLSSLATASIDLLHPAKMLQDISTILQQSVGGTSGAIYSLFFQAASESLQSDDDDDDPHPYPTIVHYLRALAAGNDAIVRYALTELGDRTMLDPLRQGEFRLRTAVQQSLPAVDCVEIFAAACGEAAKDTQRMRPRSGRATYSASGGDVDGAASDFYRHPDPGAHAVAIWARALFEAFTIFFNK